MYRFVLLLKPRIYEVGGHQQTEVSVLETVGVAVDVPVVCPVCGIERSKLDPFRYYIDQYLDLRNDDRPYSRSSELEVEKSRRSTPDSACRGSGVDRSRLLDLELARPRIRPVVVPKIKVLIDVVAERVEFAALDAADRADNRHIDRDAHGLQHRYLGLLVPADLIDPGFEKQHEPVHGAMLQHADDSSTSVRLILRPSPNPLPKMRNPASADGR